MQYSHINNTFTKKNFLRHITLQSKVLENEIFFFGVMMAINYPLYWLVWNSIISHSFQDLCLRFIATSLCLGLILRDSWLRSYQKFFPVYWYTTLIFCLPFFFTYTTLIENGAVIFLISNISALFFLLILVNLLDALVIWFIGAVVAVGVFKFTQPPFRLELGTISVQDFFWLIFAAFVIGGLFSFRRDLSQRQKSKALKNQAAIIAQEMRTPLLILSTIAYRLQNHLPPIIEGCQKSIKSKFLTERLRHNITLVKDAPKSIENTTRRAFTIIDMLLMNLKGAKRVKTTSETFLAPCIEEALKEYPFQGNENSLVNWQPGSDFKFRGNSEIVKHILFNLLKNALYYIKAAEKGTMTIWLEKDEKWNMLHFKDTGKGVSTAMLPHIFDQFFSKHQHGIGVGLAFCRQAMESIDGYIMCQSVEGEYTHFVLFFPKIL